MMIFFSVDDVGYNVFSEIDTEKMSSYLLSFSCQIFLFQIFNRPIVTEGYPSSRNQLLLHCKLPVPCQGLVLGHLIVSTRAF